MVQFGQKQNITHYELKENRFLITSGILFGSAHTKAGVPSGLILYLHSLVNTSYASFFNIFSSVAPGNCQIDSGDSLQARDSIHVAGQIAVENGNRQFFLSFIYVFSIPFFHYLIFLSLSELKGNNSQ